MFKSEFGFSVKVAYLSQTSWYQGALSPSHSEYPHVHIISIFETCISLAQVENM